MLQSVVVRVFVRTGACPAAPLSPPSRRSFRAYNYLQASQNLSSLKIISSEASYYKTAYHPLP